MKRPTLSVLLVLAFVMLAAAPATAAEEPLVAPAPEAAPVLDAAIPADAACPAPDPAAALGLTVEPAWHCLYGAPHCFNDDHCDKYCGDPRFGACLSNGCCGCYG